MAFLRLGIFALITSIGTLGGILGGASTRASAAEITPPPSHLAFVRAGAWRSIERCDWSRASLWAGLLQKESSYLGSDAALLYRLAWFQAGPAKPREKKTIDSEKTWSWGFGGASGPSSGPEVWAEVWPEVWPEVWKDELEFLTANTECSREHRRASGFEEMPAQPLKSVLAPYFSSNTARSKKASKLEIPSLHLGTREILRKYALFLWISGETLEIPKFADSSKTSSWSKNEQCEWRALRLIHAQASEKNAEQFEKFLSDCNGLTGLFASTVSVEAGDQYWKNGQMAKAFGHFQNALKHIPQHVLPQTLAYRIAVSGFLSRAKDDYSMRIAYELLTETDRVSNSPDHLQPLLKNSLQNLVCDRLVQLHSRDAVQVLEKVFGTRLHVEKSLVLAQACDQTELAPLWKALLPKSKEMRQKTDLLGLLIRSAFQRKAIAEAKNLIQELAKLSGDSPFHASRQFWNAIAHESPKVRPVQIELAKYYISKAEFLAVDEQRLRRLETAKDLIRPDAGVVGVSTQNPGILAKDNFEAESGVKLPFASSVPRVTFKKALAVDFMAALDRELNNGSRNRSF